jgi:hypothetical protein
VFYPGDVVKLEIYPNPFRNVTTFRIEHAIKDGIDYSDKKKDYGDKRRTTINIYDVTGRIVKFFSHITHFALRPTLVTWQGDNQNGDPVPAGVYFIKLDDGQSVVTEKVLLLH